MNYGISDRVGGVEERPHAYTLQYVNRRSKKGAKKVCVGESAGRKDVEGAVAVAAGCVGFK